METVNTVIVGASAAGLACAAHLEKRGIDYKLIEKHNHVANAWRNHYERLNLHTNRSASSLPFVKFNKQIAKYPSRLEVIAYLENYCKTLGIEPSFNTTVKKIYKSDKNWITETDQAIIESKNVIICTGNTNIPKKYSKPGLDDFPGRTMHSSEYKNGIEFKGKKVLVIGFGNSACEIAVCLHEHGAKTSVSVRSPVNVIPRDILGIPVLQIGTLQSKLSPALADKMNQPLIQLLIGDIEKYGLQKLPYGPTEQIVKHQKIPVLDIGIIKRIKQGHIGIRGDISNIKKETIQFENGTEEQFDAIIIATGYENGINRILDLDAAREADLKLKVGNRNHFGKDEIFFCGYYVAPTGMLREINLESGLIAAEIQNTNI